MPMLWHTLQTEILLKLWKRYSFQKKINISSTFSCASCVWPTAEKIKDLKVWSEEAADMGREKKNVFWLILNVCYGKIIFIIFIFPKSAI